MSTGEKITLNSNGTLNVPDCPIIPFIEGDGTGPDIWKATQKVLDSAVQIQYGGKKKIDWLPLAVGEKAYQETGEYLSREAMDTIQEYRVALKGPLTTPVGKGIRSLNVTLRQKLDLYACVRPVKYIDPVPSPMKHPETIDMVIFRENTEDVYAGIEWASGSPEAEKVAAFLTNEMGAKLPEHAGIGIKPMSPGNSKRLVAAAITYALEHNLPSVTLMHKGNIMKYTEGAFASWGYEVARERFGDQTVTETELTENFGGNSSRRESGHQGPDRGHALSAGASAAR